MFIQDPEGEGNHVMRYRSSMGGGLRTALTVFRLISTVLSIFLMFTGGRRRGGWGRRW